jgi:hypothetical protein
VIAEENITSRNDGGEVHFGIELEIDSKEHIPNKETLAGTIAGNENDFYCKSDSSLNYGFEIVSHPVTFDYFKKNKEKFQKVLKDAKEFGFRSHDAGTCGMHVHVSKDGISNVGKCRYKAIGWWNGTRREGSKTLEFSEKKMRRG